MAGGEKGFIWLTPPQSSSKDIRTGTKTGQEPRAGADAMLTGLLLMTCLVYFLIQPRTTSPREWHHPQ